MGIVLRACLDIGIWVSRVRIEDEWRAGRGLRSLLLLLRLGLSLGLRLGLGLNRKLITSGAGARMVRPYFHAFYVYAI